MVTQPNNISFEELKYVLLAIGCEKRDGKGSHYIFHIPGTNSRLTVPKHKPVRACYIRQALRIFGLEEIRDEEN
jgi:predicted RNA binding protein YcfA (HicA-like mRNA interferase family)